MSESWFEPDPNFKQLKERLQLRTTDGKIFTVHKYLLRHSGFIQKLIEEAEEKNEDVEEPIEIENTDGEVMIKILQFLAYHQFDPVLRGNKENEDVKLSNWDNEYLKEKDGDFLYQLIITAAKLQIYRLRDVCAKKFKVKVT